MYNLSNHTVNFSNPSSNYRWHAIIHNISGIAMQDIDNFAEAHVKNWIASGEGGLVTNITFSNEYLDNPNAFDHLSRAAGEILKCGLNVWLYDELGYPSGAAGGRTTLNRPDLSAKGLVCISHKGHSFDQITIKREEELMRFIHAYVIDGKGETIPVSFDANEAAFDGTEGEWTLYVFAEKKLYQGTHAETNGFKGTHWIQRDYPNLIDPKAVEAFINNTYVPYAEKYRYFDRAIGVFTDEPSLMEAYLHTGSTVHKYAQLAWTDGLEYKFEEMHGYPLMNKLHLIFESDSDEAKIVRVNFRQTIAEVFAKTYFAALSEFCRSHGTKLSGHGLLEETLPYHAIYYGDLMKCLREMDIPGVDSLAANPAAYMNPGWPLFMAVKYATSVATLNGNRHTMVEFCAPDIDTSNMDAEAKRKIMTTLNLMFFQGVTHINSYFAIEYLGEDRRFFADYFARLAYMSRSMKWDSNVAIYYPINTNQAYTKPSRTASVGDAPKTSCISNVAKKLYESSLDFTVADNVFFEEAKVVNGRIFTDTISFTAVIVPGAEIIPLSVMKKLREFEESGGKVVWIGSVPSLADRFGDTGELSGLTSGLTAMSEDEAVAKVKAETDLGITISGGEDHIYLGKYILDGNDAYWIFNYGSGNTSVTVCSDAAGYDVYDPENGEITSYDGGETSITLNDRRAKIIVKR